MQYREPEHLSGFRTEALFPRGVKERTETAFGIHIKEWEDDASNGVFYISICRGKQAEAIGVHYDEPRNWMSGMVYLTPDAPLYTGTSFWQHRKTGLRTRPTKRDADERDSTVEALDRILDRDSWRLDRWIEVDRVANEYNRGIIFSNDLLHSATKHFGSNVQNGRIFYSFNFSIER